MVDDHQSRERKAAVRSFESASGQTQTFADLDCMSALPLECRLLSPPSASELWAIFRPDGCCNFAVGKAFKRETTASW
jgi:hypothetical protein